VPCSTQLLKQAGGCRSVFARTVIVLRSLRRLEIAAIYSPKVRLVDMAMSTHGHRYSIYPTAGLEGKAVEKNSYYGNTIAVFTSGGDAQGTVTHFPFK